MARLLSRFEYLLLSVSCFLGFLKGTKAQTPIHRIRETIVFHHSFLAARSASVTGS